MNIAGITDILENLETGAITWEQALRQVTSLPKVWQTAEWKARRQALIQDNCAVCATTKGPFVLQHLTPTLSFKEMCQVVKYELRQQLLPQVNAALPDAEVAAHIGAGESRKACPHCGALSIRHRLTIAPHYVCGKYGPGGAGFDEPTAVAYYIKQRTTDRAYAMKLAREFLASVATIARLREYDQQIQHEATLRSLRQSLAYRSLTHTATYCKGCAFKADWPYMLRQAQ
ncbi:hypothetical protein FNT36_23830 [Hymenobacter setariae]|jgi:hypothetical protein|uniref:Uncharacterized protein n=1 Tax=Hymenobacter setariae TaxID=2594794 RepID=A0A558BK90_9BACT|nr:hypothetical protein [Hymenobacter setariae]TVT36903.1 hypothetical protein FNT36_23830 [Hymenobacter setariae]